MKKINLAIVGATGMVGKTFLEVLEGRKIKKCIKNMYLFASEDSEGKEIDFNGKTIKVEVVSEKNIKNKFIDYAFFSVGEDLSKIYAPIFTKFGVQVIDNSSAFRMEKNIPLIVPEVNMQKTNSPIIANPNCSTIQCVLPLKVLADNYGLKSVSFCTYQAVSGSGMNGVYDLKRTQQGESAKFYPHPIFNNCLPHIGSFSENGYTSEELKMITETQKILGFPNLRISATCVRVPVENCHSVAVSVKLRKKFNLEKVKKQFNAFENLVVLDDNLNNVYPINTLANGKNEVFIGRLRQDLFESRVLHFWCVADNIRKGAATNGVQILEKLLNF